MDFSNTPYIIRKVNIKKNPQTITFKFGSSKRGHLTNTCPNEWNSRIFDRKIFTVMMEEELVFFGFSENKDEQIIEQENEHTDQEAGLITKTITLRGLSRT